MTDPDPRTVTFLPLQEIKPDPRNPKSHHLETIDQSIGRFGMVDGIVRDDRTGYIISGHGRRKALQAMRDRGETPPEGVKVSPAGEWLIPVLTGWASRTDSEAAAALIAMNRTTELGGWVDEELLDLLGGMVDEFGEGSLIGVGYSPDDITNLRESMEEVTEELIEGKYTKHSSDIHYEPLADEAPPTTALVDTDKVDSLIDEINGEDGIPEEVRRFLTLGAYRHAVFNYAQIAEFYAHAEPRVQALMERSALVLLDIEDAIRNGYLAMAEELDELVDADLAERDEDEGEDQ